MALECHNRLVAVALEHRSVAMALECLNRLVAVALWSI